ncbi:hypothetical protein [Pseudoduganella violaceinigra]|uniref:hypothetical protein n=1 Tax=Pseudoduganella violaceinigra TaxID=246602 RepID=UPI0004131EED|nr:hypothetical protein [Pseudoduganella violaceinigra]
MNEAKLKLQATEFLFGRGQALDHYYIEVSRFSESLCYKNDKGREFDLAIDDEDLAQAVMLRLREMDVRIVKHGA